VLKGGYPDDYLLSVLLGPRRLFSRLEKTIASNSPIPAPKAAPEMVRLRGKYDPLPAVRKPTHPITNIQRSMRSRIAHTPITRYGKTALSNETEQHCILARTVMMTTYGSPNALVHCSSRT
jgi:hypothetical protein